MAIYKMFRGMVITRDKLDVFIPETVPSGNWKYWKSALTLKTCEMCRELNGKIYAADEEPVPAPPLHPNCRCEVEVMKAVEAGKGSIEGENGADWWLRYHGVLPEYYISAEELKRRGWKWGESPIKYAPGTMLTIGVYRNENKHLPDTPGRIWFEADLNYRSGKRNKHRILWSNDGLIFVTYDHYTTFFEIV